MKYLKPLVSFALFFSLQSTFAMPEGATTKAIIPNYPTMESKKCSGFPQVMVESIDGTCLGLVADKTNGLRMPRYAVQSPDGIIYIADMGSFDFGVGTIWALRIPKINSDQSNIELVNLFPKKIVNLPNGLLLDPEGRLYVGTPTGVFRFSPLNEKNEFNLDEDMELIENGFMNSIFRKDEYSSKAAWEDYFKNKKQIKHRHPLVQLAANKNFTEIYLNVGAPSDACTLGLKTKNDEGFCVQAESSLVNAGVWKIKLTADSKRKKIATEAMARGLRNSMGLAVHPVTQKLYQAENSMDLKDEKIPFEEINLIEEGRHYGWPYCHSNDQVNEAFADVVKPEVCLKKYSPALINMPAHVAPLGLLFYESTYFEKLTGKLMVSWHGYRENGQKVVTYELDQKGHPLNHKPENIIFNWAAKNKVRPLGAPVGMTQLLDGRLLVLDDKNKSVLILAKGDKYDDDGSDEEELVITENQIKAIQPLLPFINSTCVMCHSGLAQQDPRKMIESLFKLNMLNIDEPLKSKLFIRVENKDMPMNMKLEQKNYEDFVEKIKNFLKTLDENKL